MLEAIWSCRSSIDTGVELHLDSASVLRLHGLSLFSLFAISLIYGLTATLANVSA